MVNQADNTIASLRELRAARWDAIAPIIVTVAVFATLIILHVSPLLVAIAFIVLVFFWGEWFSRDYEVSEAEKLLKSYGFPARYLPVEIDVHSHKPIPSTPPPRTFSA